MSRSSWLRGTLFAAALVLGVSAERSAAQTVIVGAPPADCAAPLAVSYYAAPAVSYYAAPTVSYYAPAPTVSYYAPAAVAVTTLRPGILPRREIVTTRYYSSAPAPVVTYAPAPVYAAPRVAAYYTPVYLYP